MEATTQHDPNFNKDLFGTDFTWGISAAAVQIEGACNDGGKGKSIWDVFAEKKGRIRDNHHHATACDFYHRYKSDIDLIKQLNIPNFRFSIAWSRVLPEGTGAVNQTGIDFYNRVIDYCIEQGIEPWITVYHWDLPQALEIKGGWTNRQVVHWFEDFVTVCAQSFGDRVKKWMIMNEPSVFTGAGYFFGIHAPGKSGLINFIPAAHHAVLSMAAGGRALRKALPDAYIGTTFSCSYIEPWSDKPKDIAAAKRVDALLNRMYIEPLLGMGYPVEDLPVLRKIARYMQPSDEEHMKFDFDFIGVQPYTREIVRHSFFTPYLSARLVKATVRKVPVTLMGWEVYPPAIYEIIKKYNQYQGVRDIYITENGAAFTDRVVNGKVDDPERMAYLQQYLKEVLKAKDEGYKVSGYFVWTLTDNFEWAEGYNPRFGIVHVNFDTQERIVKSSGYWYRDFIKQA